MFFLCSPPSLEVCGIRRLSSVLARLSACLHHIHQNRLNSDHTDVHYFEHIQQHTHLHFNPHFTFHVFSIAPPGRKYFPLIEHQTVDGMPPNVVFPSSLISNVIIRPSPQIHIVSNIWTTMTGCFYRPSG